MKVIITVFGNDKVGILAMVCSFLAKHNINIEDISQTVMKGSFNMIMRVDVSESGMTLSELASAIGKEGEANGVDISLRHEDLFNAMHRI